MTQNERIRSLVTPLDNETVFSAVDAFYFDIIAYTFSELVFGLHINGRGYN